MHSNHRVIAGLVLSWTLVAAPAYAGRTLYVATCGEAEFGGLSPDCGAPDLQKRPKYPIQAAIDAAQDGDTIVVAPGAYSERLDFLGKAITLRSAEGPQVTTVDANGLGRAVSFVRREGPDSVLEGLTITGGVAAFGGGVTTSPHFYFWQHPEENASPTIRRCIFQGNVASTGSALFARPGTTVSNCLFTNNGPGHALFLHQNSMGLSKITNCTIADNDGGLRILVVTSPWDPPAVVNCIIRDTIDGNFSLMRISYCNITSIPGPWPGPTNIADDPLFVNPAAGDYRLSAGSPCLDVGNSLHLVTQATDLDGQPRLADDPDAPDAGVPFYTRTIDMGAYERQSEAVCP